LKSQGINLPDLDRLETVLGYKFQNRALLERAITHRSWAHEQVAPGAEDQARQLHNEALEFLGDSVLGLIVAAYLCKAYPAGTEGELSRMKHRLVSASTLAEASLRLNLGDFLRFGRGEEKSGGRRKDALLADVLEGFLANRPMGVSVLMGLRNLLVTPLRLRTSPLGCPASSLLSKDRENLFADRYPVLSQSVPSRNHAEVLLGADDRHLSFRSSVGVRYVGDDAHITLGTRVQCRNAFGRFYIAAIERVHRMYIAPQMLTQAVEHAQGRLSDVEASTVLAF